MNKGELTSFLIEQLGDVNRGVEVNEVLEIIAKTVAASDKMYIAQYVGGTLARLIVNVFNKHAKANGSLNGLPRQEEISSRLFMSSQTLRRRLKLEDLDIVWLRNEFIIRYGVIACKYKSLNLAQLAYILGFSERESLYRMVLDHTGSHPKSVFAMPIKFGSSGH